MDKLIQKEICCSSYEVKFHSFRNKTEKISVTMPSPRCFRIKIDKHELNILLVPKGIQNCPKLFKAVHSFPKLPKAAQSCPKLSKAVQSCPKWSKTAQSCQKLLKVSQSCKITQISLHFPKASQC